MVISNIYIYIRVKKNRYKFFIIFIMENKIIWFLCLILLSGTIPCANWKEIKDKMVKCADSQAQYDEYIKKIEYWNCVSEWHYNKFMAMTLEESLIPFTKMV